MTLRRDDGSAIVSVIGVVLVLLLLGSAALSLSQRRLTTSARDRDVARAAAAADAGADVAGLRMNRLLVGVGSAGLLGVPADVLRTAGCVLPAPGGGTVVEPAPAGEEWCPQSAGEPMGDGARFSYAIGTAASPADSAAGSLVRRRVVATGRSGGVVRRVLATYELDLGADAPSRLFRRARYVVCSATPAPARADGGCPDPERTG